MTVFPTSYFPSISYLRAICSVENGFIDLGEHYVKQTHRNRCSILTANGKQDLSIPVIRPSGNKSSTSAIEVSPELNWRRDHWRSISAAYASSPYFEHYAEDIKNLIFQNTLLLFEFNQECLSFVKNCFLLPQNLSFSSQYIELPTKDYRDFKFHEDNIPYQQVFHTEDNFVPQLSVLDALFCIGPMARNLIII